jgi:hypothetical protein
MVVRGRGNPDLWSNFCGWPFNEAWGTVRNHIEKRVEEAAKRSLKKLYELVGSENIERSAE